MRFRYAWIWILAAVMCILPCNRAWAAFGQDIERPKPEFTQEGGDWIATLIPRGKSTAITIRFHVDGGSLAQPADKVFTDADMPKIDLKNYRSGFFTLEITPSAPGGEVTLSMASAYFNTGTEIWGAKERASRTWGSVGAVNAGTKGAGATNTLTFAVRDGSLLDEDGTANGRIQVIAAPRDSFWGYALGTLFIRFFGVFLVLGVMEIGMIVSGKIFQALDKPNRPTANEASFQSEPIPLETAPDAGDVSPEVAAAIAVALHLGSGKALLRQPGSLKSAGMSTWGHFGRGKLMDDRMPVFNRVQR